MGNANASGLSILGEVGDAYSEESSYGSSAASPCASADGSPTCSGASSQSDVQRSLTYDAPSSAMRSRLPSPIPCQAHPPSSAGTHDPSTHYKVSVPKSLMEKLYDLNFETCPSMANFTFNFNCRRPCEGSGGKHTAGGGRDGDGGGGGNEGSSFPGLPNQTFIASPCTSFTPPSFNLPPEVASTPVTGSNQFNYSDQPTPSFSAYESDISNSDFGYNNSSASGPQAENRTYIAPVQRTPPPPYQSPPRPPVAGGTPIPNFPTPRRPYPQQMISPPPPYTSRIRMSGVCPAQNQTFNVSCPGGGKIYHSTPIRPNVNQTYNVGGHADPNRTYNVSGERRHLPAANANVTPGVNHTFNISERGYPNRFYNVSGGRHQPMPNQTFNVSRGSRREQTFNDRTYDSNLRNIPPETSTPLRNTRTHIVIQDNTTGTTSVEDMTVEESIVDDNETDEPNASPGSRDARSLGSSAGTPAVCDPRCNRSYNVQESSLRDYTQNIGDSCTANSLEGNATLTLNTTYKTAFSGTADPFQTALSCPESSQGKTEYSHCSSGSSPDDSVTEILNRTDNIARQERSFVLKGLKRYQAERRQKLSKTM